MEDSLVFYISLSLCTVLLTVKIIFHFQTRKQKLPPSPISLPFFGNLHHLKPPLHRTFHTLSKTYGQIFSLRFGSRLVVVVSSPSAVHECFTKNDVVLANRPRFITGKYINYNYTTVTVAPYGEHWRNLRRIGSLEIFSTHRVNSFLGVRRDEMRMMLKKISQASCKNSGKVELKTMLSEMTFNTVMRMIAGKRYYGDDNEVTDTEEARQFRALMKELTLLGGANNPGDFSTVLRWLDYGGAKKKLKKMSKSMDAFLQGLIEEHRSKKARSESTNTMIDHLLSLQEQQHDYYTDQIIKGFILVILLAGTDTSSITIEWAMCNLLNHPEIMKKARAELDSHVGQDRLVEEADVSKLPYLQNIISETLRLYPTVPLLVPHMASDFCTIEGYDIPKDTTVLVNAWALHRDPKLWDDPTSFKPERFENVGETQKIIPFGLGRRACPGAGLAQRTVSLALGLLIQCFEWDRPTVEEIDMTEERGITLSKTKPLEALCKARQSIFKLLSEEDA